MAICRLSEIMASYFLLPRKYALFARRAFFGPPSQLYVLDLFDMTPINVLREIERVALGKNGSLAAHDFTMSAV